MSSRRLFPLALVAAVAVSLLAAELIGLGRVAQAPASAPAPDAKRACSVRPGTTMRVSVPVDGQGFRSALVHFPRQRYLRRVPLVLALHGAYANGAFMERYSGLSRVSDSTGFVVVYPDSATPKWRISEADGIADVQFIDALLDHILDGGCSDSHRVSAVGVSNGGGMAARLACDGEDRLAGLVSVAGAYGPLPPCQAHRSLSILEIHGTADRVVPYGGSPQVPEGDAVHWLTDWADRDSCQPGARTVQARPNVDRLDWTGCRDGTTVEHLRLIGGTHAWPGADPPDPGPRLGVSAADEAWTFLRFKRLSPSVS